jgi:DNA-binding MurR/RpiR family transcriptional regulator
MPVPARVPSTASFEAPPVGEDLLEPLAFLLAKYVKIPTLGYPMLDEFIGNLRVTARGTTEEAVERAANLVRYGDRGQLFILLGGVAVAGWLLARQSQDERLHDVTPAR